MQSAPWYSWKSLHSSPWGLTLIARILIVDGSPAVTQDAVSVSGGARSGENYAAALQSQSRAIAAPLDFFILAAGDGEGLPQGMALSDFHGIAWTGSPFSTYEKIPAVTSQIALARAAFESGVPCFGSCWGLQVMAVALGGQVRLNPKGYEIGIARQITLNEAGRSHPMFNSKLPVFDAICTHQDDVALLPSGARLLAGNDVSDVQAVEIADGNRSFWGVQYHPEFDLRQIAVLMRRRSARLVKDGFAETVGEIEAVSADFLRLHQDPTRRDLSWRYGIGRDVLEPDRHRREFANWLSVKVAPRLEGMNKAD